MLMADIAMAAYAGHLAEVLLAAVNTYGFDHLLMTVSTRFLGDLAIVFGYLYRLVKATNCKVIRMPKAIRCLCVVFPEEIMRGVAVVAGRRGVVAGFLPAIELLAHDMAICTRARIVAHV